MARCSQNTCYVPYYMHLTNSKYDYLCLLSLHVELYVENVEQLLKICYLNPLLLAGIFLHQPTEIFNVYLVAVLSAVMLSATRLTVAAP